jgi:DNA-binding response OmpR family regulator
VVAQSAAATDFAPERAVVLVADDDRDILELVALRLTGDGYEVVTAADGEAALRLARERRPDLAVLDVMMPKLGGLDVTRALRADAATKALPVILLTARVQDGDHAEGVAAGADAYVKKPFDARDLRTQVAELLARP